MRIALSSTADATRPFGSFARAFWLGEELAKNGHAVVHFCPLPPGGHGLKASYVGLRAAAGPREAGTLRAFAMSHYRLIGINPDVLYVHRTTNLMFAALRLIRLYPTVLDVHGSEYMEYNAYGQVRKADKARLLEAVMLSWADCVIAASTELKDFLMTEYDVDGGRIFVVPNGVPLDTLLRPPSERSAWREHLGLRKHELLLLASAPSVFGANDLSMAFLAEVARLATRQNLPARFVVTGREEAPEGIAPLGTVEDYIGLIDESDVTLLPYPPSAVCGGARTKTLEFMARGKPIVSTKEGMRGVEDATPGNHYMLADDPGDMVSTIAELLGNPEKRSSLGRAAKMLARSHLWSGSAARLEMVLKDCLSGT